MRWIALVLVGLGAAQACAGGSTVSSSEDDGTEITSAAGGAASTGGMAGQGGTGPCSIDCASIDTPDCQVAECNAATGQCEVVNDADGVACDDGMFCTIDDACTSGECQGGPPNDCSLEPTACEQVTCDETAQACELVPSANGAPCINTSDLCLVSPTCSNGVCTSTQTNDCFFTPVPDDCHVAVCDPADGMCKPEPGNFGMSCVDQTDLCTVGKTCDTMGNCL